MFDPIRQQVAITRAGNFAGMSFFFDESLWNMTSESPEPRKADLRFLNKNLVARVDFACQQDRSQYSIMTHLSEKNSSGLSFHN